MYKGIGLVIALVGGSLLTTGFVSALLDLSAFVVLVYMVNNHPQFNQVKQTKAQDARFAFNLKKNDKNKLDITP
ncbi:hypothetical protein [Photobacterium kagoshimensis]|uniref:hypothetical protein n=1 Tax=Photobacterium kagoshimensis TaxID=2910242 RepID=UPI003D11FA07